MVADRQTSPDVRRAFERLREEVAQLFRRYERTLLRLAKSDWLAFSDPTTALQQISEAAAETLSVARVGIWLFDADRTVLRCADLFESGQSQHSSGQSISATDYPAYFAALEENRTIVAHNARIDPRTNELAPTYLIPNGISSMLDAPIRLGGGTIGVVCHEHVGPQRAWSRDEQVFAGSMADVVALALDSWKRKWAEDEQRELERKLLDAQRLESLGLLAGGIAHDFNNLLTAISGNLSLAQKALSPSSPAWPYLQHVQVAATLASDLTRNLLAYAGQGTTTLDRLDVNGVVEAITKLLRVAVPRSVSVECDLSRERLVIEADSGQFQQVLMNLIVNAAEAIGDAPGTITVSTGLVHPDAGYLASAFRLSELAPGPYVCLEVADSGRGMDEETASRVFDPFFSTKLSGRGLGLSVAFGIVRSHGGAIRVDSMPGEGARFTVLFPAKLGVAADVPREPPVALPWRGGGLVLVIDDEEIVRAVAGEMLVRLGFEVMTCPDGESGVARYRTHHRDLVAVLLDLTMPHWSGAKTLAQLRLAGCEAPVLLMSGLNEREAAGELIDPSLGEFLPKPFTFDELSKKLRRLVSRRGQADTVTDASRLPLSLVNGSS